MLQRHTLISQLVDLAATNQRLIHRQLSQAAAVLDLPYSRLHALAAIGRLQPVSSRRLAADLSLSPGAIAQAIDQLAARQLVQRQAQPQDRRVELLSLTAAGIDTVAAFKQAKLAVLERALDGLQDDELQAYVALQQKLHAKLRQPEGSHA